MLMPKKMKYRKQQRGKRRGMAYRGSDIIFGKYALKSLECGWISARQIEAGRRAITRYIKRGGEVWIRVFPDKPVTTTSAETPMGSGKGAVDHFSAVVKPGRIIYELDGVPFDIAKEALRLASHKMSVKTSFIHKEE
jgi:large subunit ribosomal protein L16